jgi:hypothetical protein
LGRHFPKSEKVILLSRGTFVLCRCPKWYIIQGVSKRALQL